jgi:hypothetical protein
MLVRLLHAEMMKEDPLSRFLDALPVCVHL